MQNLTTMMLKTILAKVNLRNSVANRMPVSIHTSDSNFEFIDENKLNAFIREEFQKAFCEHYVEEVDFLHRIFKYVRLSKLFT